MTRLGPCSAHPAVSSAASRHSSPSMPSPVCVVQKEPRCGRADEVVKNSHFSHTIWYCNTAVRETRVRVPPSERHSREFTLNSHLCKSTSPSARSTLISQNDTPTLWSGVSRRPDVPKLILHLWANIFARTKCGCNLFFIPFSLIAFTNA